MHFISDLTYKVVAYTVVPDFNTDLCVDWAVEMMALGYESENLFILAGLSKPTNYFETINYLQKALAELGLQVKQGEDGIASYSYYYVKRIVQRKAVKQNLEKLKDYVFSNGLYDMIYDFYSLYWAWSDLEEGYMHYYWDGATLDNIEHLVVDRARQWIVEHELKYIQAAYK